MATNIIYNPGAGASAAQAGTENYIANGNDKLMWESYQKAIFDAENRYKDFKIFDLLKEIKSKKSVNTPLFGHLLRDRYILNFRPNAVVADPGAGVGLQFVINAADHKNGATFPSVSEEYEMANGTFVKVIGKDTGADDGLVKGFTLAGVPITPGSIGGTPTAHVIVVQPLQAASNIGAIDQTTYFVFRSGSVGELSDKVDGKSTDPIEYQNCLGNVRHDYTISGNAATNIVWLNLDLDGSAPGGGKTDVWALNDYYTNALVFDAKIEHKLLFVPKTDNPNLATSGRTTNGAIPQILADGYTHFYQSGNLQLQDFNQFVKYFVKNGGAMEYCILAGYDIYEAIQNLMRNYFKDGSIEYGKSMMSKDTAVNFDFMTFKYNGITFHLKLFDAFTDRMQSGASGFKYDGEAMLFPMSRMSVWDKQQFKNVPKERMIYRYKAEGGDVRDENNHWLTGGAVLAKSKRTSTIDGLVMSWLAEVGMEMVGTRGFGYLKRI